MPEGPSLVLLKEKLLKFRRKRVLTARGSAPIDLHRMEGAVIRDIRTWGKHLLIYFDGFYVRIHLLMFGTVLFDTRKAVNLRLGLGFKSAEVNFYTCSIKLFEGHPDDDYDWERDVMNPAWNARKAGQSMKAKGDVLITDLLLDQAIFSGVGNIIKNEVLFRVMVHPLSVAGKIPAARRRLLLKDVVDFCFLFLAWRKVNQLKQHLLVYGRKTCVRCAIPLHKSHPGTRTSATFYCNNCQLRYR